LTPERADGRRRAAGAYGEALAREIDVWTGFKLEETDAR
jgi:hypothetical protein